MGGDTSPERQGSHSAHGTSVERVVSLTGPEPKPQSQAAFAVMIHDIRHSRDRDLPNSRPMPDWVRRLAWFLDSAFRVPGTKDRRVGVDGFVTLVPGVGDAIGVTVSIVVVLTGVAAGVSIPTVLRMLLNVGIEGVVGLVPLGGALFDMVFKANVRNVILMERDLADRAGTRRSSLLTLMVAALVVIVGMVMVVVLWLAAIVLVVWALSKLV